MTFAKTIAKKTLIIAGLNSGTSADGLDLAVMKIAHQTRGIKISFLKGGFKRYPDELRDLVLELAASKSSSLDQLIYTDNLLGQFYGRATKSLISRCKKEGIKIDAIASHGQSVRHCPQKRKLVGSRVNGTLQIGSPEWIAAISSLPVISDFRQAAVALGQEGAPITVAAMAEMFSDLKVPRLIVNIGGMANYFYLPQSQSQKEILAADCGPGNSLIDICAGELFGQSFDKGGRLAACGSISESLLRWLRNHKFFTSKRKSTGREEFGQALARKIIQRGRRSNLSYSDIMATVTELTVFGIVRSLKPLLRGDDLLTKLYLTGGGVHNSFLKSRLQSCLNDIDLLSIDRLGYNPNLVEAAAYAVMGAACLKSRPLVSAYPSLRTQNTIGVLGRISQPPLRKK